MDALPWGCGLALCLGALVNLETGFRRWLTLCLPVAQVWWGLLPWVRWLRSWFWARRRLGSLDSEILEFTEGLRSLVSAGLILPDALEKLATRRIWHVVLDNALQRVRKVRASGRSFQVALSSVLEDGTALPPALSLVFSCCLLCQTRGGNLVVLLGKVHESQARSLDLRQKYLSETAQIRMQARVILSAPAVIWCLLSLINLRWSTVYFRSLVGMLVFAAMVSLNLGAFFMLKRMGRKFQP